MHMNHMTEFQHSLHLKIISRTAVIINYHSTNLYSKTSSVLLAIKSFADLFGLPLVLVKNGELIKGV